MQAAGTSQVFLKISKCLYNLTYPASHISRKIEGDSKSARRVNSTIHEEQVFNFFYKMYHELCTLVLMT